ncbi:hypothetical protein Q6A51_27045 [Pseudomonas sp. KFB-139]|uniref:Uncharacterized protein n=1 Tax=Pseudomonas serbiensis TaxID=3064350 RepID=A0ABT9CY47_9PSED|nr:hypothetical protein [Pseudomonas sp. KFB-138]MDO7930431.1 hypothetical protein [Pseudomonas sp. KFB-138]
MNTKIALFMLCVFLGSAHASELVKNAGNEVYEVDKKNTQDLKVSWSGGSTIAKGVIGEKGEITRDLVSFNGKKALHYENLASRTQFEAYVTLKINNNELLVDCVYGNIRSEQNGTLINKAVCGLNEKLIADYEQFIYEYSEVWKGEVALAATKSLMQDPSTPASVEDAVIKDIKISRIYASRDDLIFNLPSTIISQNERTHSFGPKMIFTVFNKSNLKMPDHIEVASERLEAPFEKMGYERLSNFLK